MVRRVVRFSDEIEIAAVSKWTELCASTSSSSNYIIKLKATRELDF